jgi:probable DNA metabolism protein
VTIFFYDRTFEGLLTAIFDAYSRKTFPDKLLPTGATTPLFTDEEHTVITQDEHAGRVWTALRQKMPSDLCNMLMHVWLSEAPESDELLFRYIRKIIDAPRIYVLNFSDPDVLQIRKLARKVAHEALYLKQFVRFQKAADGLFFAPVRPQHNALPLAVDHFTDRFADQQWVIYDLRRGYGYHYDLHQTREITLSDEGEHMLGNRLDSALMAKDEQLFQQLWKGYFDALTIRERLNPRLQRQHMPVRFWRDLTEKQGR